MAEWQEGIQGACFNRQTTNSNRSVTLKNDNDRPYYPTVSLFSVKSWWWRIQRLDVEDGQVCAWLLCRWLLRKVSTRRRERSRRPLTSSMSHLQRSSCAISKRSPRSQPKRTRPSSFRCRSTCWRRSRSSQWVGLASGRDDRRWWAWTDDLVRLVELWIQSIFHLPKSLRKRVTSKRLVFVGFSSGSENFAFYAPTQRVNNQQKTSEIS